MQNIRFVVGTVRDRVGTVWVFGGTVRDCLKGLKINKPFQTVPNGPYKNPHGPYTVPNGPYKKPRDVHGPSISRWLLKAKMVLRALWHVTNAMEGGNIAS